MTDNVERFYPPAPMSAAEYEAAIKALTPIEDLFVRHGDDGIDMAFEYCLVNDLPEQAERLRLTQETLKWMAKWGFQPGTAYDYDGNEIAIVWQPLAEIRGNEPPPKGGWPPKKE